MRAPSFTLWPQPQYTMPTRYVHRLPPFAHIRPILFFFLTTSSLRLSASFSTGLTPLHEACRHGNVDVATLLLIAGADVNLRDEYGTPPLYYAVASGSVACYDLLVRHGADVNAVTEEGESCLHARFVD